ncbi:MAG: hypothetical protein ACR2JE_02950 [Acidobacteriaceae bacterium]
MRRLKLGISTIAGLVFMLSGLPLQGQTGPPTQPAVLASIHRLILTDGSDQEVRRFEIQGAKVRYISAERGGAWEELPVNLVDWKATEKYAREHTPGAQPSDEPAQDSAAAIDKEAQAERAEMNARTPEITPGLRLPSLDGVWALDYFRDRPELVTLQQNSGNMNQQTGHNVLRATLNPLGGTKQQVRLDGPRSKVRLHENDPALYISLTGGDEEAGPDAINVDTQGAKAPGVVSSPKSQYIIVRAESKRDYRVVGTVRMDALGRMSQSQDVVQTTSTILPGGHWMKVVPKEPLLIEEYALIEVLGSREINLSVWDFAVDPQAPENPNAILPLERPR